MHESERYSAVENLHDFMLAKKFAEEKHGNQKYGDAPYIHHCLSVADVVCRFIPNPGRVLLISALLHDILEDTATSYSDVNKKFGVEVAEVVYALMDEKGRNRAEKKRKTYPGIRENKNAIIIKVADRIANLEHGISKGEAGFVKMYAGEQQDFEENLRLHNHIPEMWDYLNRILKEAK